MKHIKSVLLILILLLSVGCEQKTDPKKIYHALASQISIESQIDLIYMENDEEFNKRISTIQSLLEKAKLVELEKEEDQKSKLIIEKQVVNLTNIIKNSRKVILKANAKEKNGDYSLLDKSNAAMEKFSNEYRKLNEDINLIYIEFTIDSRRELLDSYQSEFDKVYEIVTKTEEIRYELAYDDGFSSEKIKRLEKSIAASQKEIKKLDTVKVDPLDQDIVDYKESSLEKILKECINSIKYIKSNNVYKNNIITQNINVLNRFAYKNLFYNIEVKPFLEETK